MPIREIQYIKMATNENWLIVALLLVDDEEEEEEEEEEEKMCKRNQ